MMLSITMREIGIVKDGARLLLSSSQASRGIARTTESFDMKSTLFFVKIRAAVAGS